MPNPYQRVAKMADLPLGCTLRIEHPNGPILLANVSGTVYACDDTCTHEDSSLSLGCLDGELIKCTLHGSRFSVRTGQPMEEPADEPLRTYPVRVEDNHIFVRC